MANSQLLRGMATLSFFAADHAAAQKWYTEILGMEPYFVRPGYVEFRIGDYQAELGIIDSKYVPDFEPTTKGPSGAIVYWHVDDLNAAIETLVSKGATLIQPPQERGEGFVTAAVTDPFGNVLGIMYNIHYLEMTAKK